MWFKKKKHYLSILLSWILILIAVCLLSLGLINILRENLPVVVGYLIFTYFLVLYYWNYLKKISKYFLFLLFFIFVILQIKTTSIKNTYLFTPFEIDQQIQRMNYYPPKLAKLGYILEYKKEIIYTEILFKNLSETLDFNTYFPDFFSFYLLPFFFIGLYLFFREKLSGKKRKKKNMVIKYLTFTILTLSFIGIHGKYGPFLIFPYIVLCLLIGFRFLFNKFKYEK